MKIKPFLAFWIVIMLVMVVSAPVVLAQDASSPLDSGLSGTSDSGMPSTDDDSLSSVAGVVVLTSFDEPDRTDAMAFALGTSREEIYDYCCNNIYGFTGYDAKGNYYDLITGAWSLENVDTDTSGLYYAYAVPDLENGYYILADGVSLPRQSCAVSIQTPGKPDINCCLSARGFLHFPWILSAEQQDQLDAFTVWLRRDNSVWAQLSEGFLFTSSDLQISQRIFEYGSTYSLQVTYPGGKTGILTFLYDGELLISDYSEGDRDGGDTDGTGSPSSSQPAPTPSASSDDDDADYTGDFDYSGGFDKKAESVAPSQAILFAKPLPEITPKFEVPSKLPSDATVQEHPNEQPTVQKPEPPVMESYSPIETVVSGLRLRDLCADGKNVVFGEGDLTVSIPAKNLMALYLGDMDTLSVTLAQPDKTLLVLGVTAAGQAVTSLPGTVLRLRYQSMSESSEIIILDESGNTIANTEFDGEVLKFPAETAGIYRISETVPASAQASGEQSTAMPMLPFAGGGVLLATGGTVAMIWRRRHV